jgi:hypothetical protein
MIHPVNLAKMRLLVVVNPNASRARDALPELEAWFAERA